MDLRRVAPIDWLVGFCGALLIGSLWLDWYRGVVGEAGQVRSVNAWQSMAVNDVIFLMVGGLAITVVIVTATQSSGAIPIAAATFTAIGGTLAAVLSLVRLIWPPDLGPGPTDRAAGVWIGAAAALALAVTAWLDLRDERRGVEGSTQVEITTLPAPKAEGV